MGQRQYLSLDTLTVTGKKLRLNVVDIKANPLDG